MENLNTFLNTYGNIASILGLLIVILGISIRQIKKFKVEKEVQKKRYNELEDYFASLVNKATTATKRQDVSIYINEALCRRRHLEMRMRTNAVYIYIISFIVIFASSIMLAIGDHNIWSYIFIPTVNVVFVVNLIIISNYNNKLARSNDALSKGYLESVEQHIQKTIES